MRFYGLGTNLEDFYFHLGGFGREPFGSELRAELLSRTVDNPGYWHNPDDTVKVLVDGDPNSGEIGKDKQTVAVGDLPALGNELPRSKLTGYPNGSSSSASSSQQAATYSKPQNKNAQITIVEFSDLQCPFCARFFKDTFPSIKKDYVDSGKVVMYFRHFPLEFHPMAVPFAIASECANGQGKFWKMHNLIFQKQSTT